LAEQIDQVIASFGYDLGAATDAIDDAVSGYRGLFAPETSRTELRNALGGLTSEPVQQPPVLDASGDCFVLYVDGSSRGNPGPAGAGAVILDADDDERELARFGHPAGSNTGNNTAEYIALQLGLSELLNRYDPHAWKCASTR
jgi:ribonuclease HI